VNWRRVARVAQRARDLAYLSKRALRWRRAALGQAPDAFDSSGCGGEQREIRDVG
jgi:hypothetical protein